MAFRPSLCNIRRKKQYAVIHKNYREEKNLRIGIVCEGKTTSRCGFEAVRLQKKGACEIYKLTVEKCGGKRRFLRRLKRCAECIRKIGISMCAASQDFPHLSMFGITVVTDGTRIFRERAGCLALMFADIYAPDADFVISGGSFSDVVSAAGEILHVRRNVVIENHAYEDIAEALYERFGVSVDGCGDGGMIKLCLNDGEKFLSFQGTFASFEDFEIVIPDIAMSEIPGSVASQFATVLEMSGVLRKKEINVAYFPKKI